MFLKGRSPQDGARRGHIGVNLGLSCSMLGHLGAMLGHLGAMLGHLGAMLGHLDIILDHVGVMLQPSWCQEASYKQKLEILMNFTSQGRGGSIALGDRCRHSFFPN